MSIKELLLVCGNENCNSHCTEKAFLKKKVIKSHVLLSINTFPHFVEESHKFSKYIG